MPCTGLGHFTRQQEKAAFGMSEKGRGEEGSYELQASLGCGGSSSCLLPSHDWTCLCHRRACDSIINSIGQGSVLSKYCSLRHQSSAKDNEITILKLPPNVKLLFSVILGGGKRI